MKGSTPQTTQRQAPERKRAVCAAGIIAMSLSCAPTPVAVRLPGWAATQKRAAILLGLDAEGRRPDGVEAVLLLVNAGSIEPIGSVSTATASRTAASGDSWLTLSPATSRLFLWSLETQAFREASEAPMGVPAALDDNSLRTLKLVREEASGCDTDGAVYIGWGQACQVPRNLGTRQEFEDTTWVGAEWPSAVSLSLVLPDPNQATVGPR